MKWVFANNTLRSIEAKQEKARSLVLYCQRLKATDKDLMRALKDVGCTDFAQFIDILKVKVKSNKRI